MGQADSRERKASRFASSIYCNRPFFTMTAAVSSLQLLVSAETFLLEIIYGVVRSDNNRASVLMDVNTGSVANERLNSR